MSEKRQPDQADAHPAPELPRPPHRPLDRRQIRGPLIRGVPPHTSAVTLDRFRKARVSPPPSRLYGDCLRARALRTGTVSPPPSRLYGDCLRARALRTGTVSPVGLYPLQRHLYAAHTPGYATATPARSSRLARYALPLAWASAPASHRARRPAPPRAAPASQP